MIALNLLDLNAIPISHCNEGSHSSGENELLHQLFIQKKHSIPPWYQIEILSPSIYSSLKHKEVYFSTLLHSFFHFIKEGLYLYATDAWLLLQDFKISVSSVQARLKTPDLETHIWESGDASGKESHPVQVHGLSGGCRDTNWV